MSQILEFIQNHYALAGSLLGLIGLFFVVESKRSGHKVSPQSLGGFVKEHNAQLIDIREPKEFEKGYISGSRNIPFTQFKEHLDELKASDRPVVLICKIGQTAGTAGQLLGKENTYRLDGGILGWQSAGLPLVKPKEEKNEPYRSKERAANKNKSKEPKKAHVGPLPAAANSASDSDDNIIDVEAIVIHPHSDHKPVHDSDNMSKHAPNTEAVDKQPIDVEVIDVEARVIEPDTSDVNSSTIKKD